MKKLLLPALAVAFTLAGCSAPAQNNATAQPLLQGAEWVIEDIASAGVIDNSHAALQFLPDGRLAGSTGCNRLMGSYKSGAADAAGAAQLSLQSAGTSRMACPPALMNQERKLLNLLPQVASYRIDRTGALELRTADQQTIVARRQN